MDYNTTLTKISQSHSGIIETNTASKYGISKAILSKLCSEGKLIRIAMGQYILPDEMQDELYSLSKRSQKIIFSHETALFLHGISDRTPFEHTITAPSNCVPSPILKAECKVYFIKPALFDLGKIELTTPAGNPVPVYDMERTICDVIRSRSRIGSETFLSALRAYAASERKNLNRLNDYSQRMRLSNVVRMYLEVLL